MFQSSSLFRFCISYNVPITTFSLCLLFICCGQPRDEFSLENLPDETHRRIDGSINDEGGVFINPESLTDQLLITEVVPAYGPFVGGNQATVRGSGFTEHTTVVVGDRKVTVQDTELIDSHRLSIVLPAGEPGLHDVTIEQEGDRVILQDGYTYNALFISPESGSTAGGTRVEIEGNGIEFSPSTRVSFGGGRCTDIEILSPSRLSCRTPSMDAGRVDVEITEHKSAAVLAIAKDAFQYVDPTNAFQGGLSGAEIDGTINITVVDSSFGIRLPGVFVIVGNDLDTTLQGMTDENGQITFSDHNLKGPVTIHAALDCYERASIVAFDATEVTVYLRTLIGIDPACFKIDDFTFDIPNFSSGPGRAISYISGEIIIPQVDEFFYTVWSKIPPPREDEYRVVYVFTTLSSADGIAFSTYTSNKLHRIIEGESSVGIAGFPYRIAARSGGLAVYAIAGIENENTRDFTPYLMGITRDVVTAPGDETENVDIVVDIPLDHDLTVKLVDLPKSTPTGPFQFEVQAHIDLGGQGVIVRAVNGNWMDTVKKISGDPTFQFFSQPAMRNALADGMYQVLVGWFTGDEDEPPYTTMIQRGIEPTDQPIILKEPLLGIPQAISPMDDETIPADRILRFEADGPRPDLHIISILGGDGMPAWRQILPGSIRESPIPDLSSISGIDDITKGNITWSVRAVRIPGFDFNTFHYDFLSSRYWTHDAYNSFSMKR